jgi:hypothetical protein
MCNHESHQAALWQTKLVKAADVVLAQQSRLQMSEMA